MWRPQIENLNQGKSLKVTIFQQNLLLRYSDILQLWQVDLDFRSFFIQLLADVPFSAFRWETPPITKSIADQPFEFVTIDSPGLARAPEPEAFASHFESATANDGIIVFPNLGQDAIMIVPCPEAAPEVYVHLAAFLRDGPEAQKHALWKTVGSEVEARLGCEPIWLSTAGAGVSWLHVRLDSRPKYYGHAPYKELNNNNAGRNSKRA